jgi:sec-independent protein translocase protein TatB
MVKAEIAGMETPTVIQAASIGTPDTLLLMLLALALFGPRRLSGIGRQIGKLLRELRKFSDDFKLQMETELRMSEEAEISKKLQATASNPSQKLDLPPPPADMAKAGAEIAAEAIAAANWEANHV